MKELDGRRTVQFSGGSGVSQGDSLRIAWIVIAAAILATLLSAYQALQNNTWQLYALLAISASLILTGSISALLVRHGRLGGIWILIIWIQATLFSISILFAGMGLISIVSILVLTGMIAPQTLPPKQVRWSVYLSLSFCIMASFIEWLRPEFQVEASAGVRFMLPALVGLVFIILAVLFARNLRKFSLRAQLMSMFILVSSLSIGAVTLFSVLYIQRTLTNDKNMQLYQAAVRTAHLVDEFITSNLNAISTETKLPELADFLSLSPDQRLGSSEADRATNLLYLLLQKDPQHIDSYVLYDLNGIDLIDTNRLEIGQDRSKSDFLSKVRDTGKPYVSNVEVLVNFVAPIIHFCAPVKNVTGNTLGTLCVRYFISVISQIIEESNGMVGEGSHAFLIDENHIRLAHGTDPTLAFKSIVPMSEALQSKLILANRLPNAPGLDLSTNLPGLEQAINRSDTHPVFTAETHGKSQSNVRNTSLEQGAITSLGTRPWKIVYVIDRATFLAPIEAQTRASVILALAIASLAAIGGLWVAQILTIPISQLTEIARQIATGDLTAQAPSESANELGTLSAAFNSMTSQLRLTLEGLEERIAERTYQLTHRANQLQASAEVGSAIASIRALDELLPKITHLISQRFGYYHAGIFLIDPTGEYAVLRAANSEGGKRMLARNHQLKINEVGIVGYVTGKKEPRIAMDVGQDAVFFNNPDLPETRSEMALPLVVGDRILGALDVQSTEPDAFTQEDIATLQLLADQVAVAIDNARLFSENQAVLDAVHRAYGEQSREAWSNLMQSHPGLGTIANKYDILYTPGQGWSSEMVQAAQVGDTVYTNNGIVAIPIKERDHILGVLRLRKPDSESWTPEELALAETLAQQLYLALENARLFQETQRRAVRERLASEITAKIRLSNDPQVILETAVQELRQALKIQADQARIQPGIQPAEVPSNNGGNAS